MFNTHQISHRLAVVTGLSLLSLLIVPNAFARPLPDGGNETVVSGSDPASVVVTSSAGFDWSAVLVVALIGIAILTVFVLRHTANRRGSQLAAR
jgi:hypothetical protein